MQSAASTHPSRQPCGHPSIARHRHRQDLGHRNVKRPPVKWPKCCPLLTVVKLGLLACQAEANCQLQTGQTSTASEQQRQQQQQLAWHIQTHIITAHTHSHTHTFVCCGIVLFCCFFLGFGFIVRMNGLRPAPSPLPRFPTPPPYVPCSTGTGIIWPVVAADLV